MTKISFNFEPGVVLSHSEEDLVGDHEEEDVGDHDDEDDLENDLGDDEEIKDENEGSEEKDVISEVSGFTPKLMRQILLTIPGQMYE